MKIPEEVRTFAASVHAGRLEEVRKMLVANPELARSPAPKELSEDRFEGTTVLHVAIQQGHAAVAEALLDAGADLEARNTQGRTPLHDALEFNNTVRELLLKRGAHVDVCAAAFMGDLRRVDELLDADAALANDRSTQLSPLGWASFSGAVASAELLLKRGAKLDDGELLCAAQVGGVDIARLLLAHGADPDEREPHLKSAPLHHAATMPFSADSRPFVKLMLESGADPAPKDLKGRTPRDLALQAAAAQRKKLEAGERVWQRPFEEVAEMLREAGG